MVDKSLTILRLISSLVKRSPRARNDKSNKRIIRFKKRNGKFAKVRRNSLVDVQGSITTKIISTS